MRPAEDAEAANADFILSIIPPGDAVATAERFAPILARAPAVLGLYWWDRAADLTVEALESIACR